MLKKGFLFFLIIIFSLLSVNGATIVLTGCGAVSSGNTYLINFTQINSGSICFDNLEEKNNIIFKQISPEIVINVNSYTMFKVSAGTGQASGRRTQSLGTRPGQIHCAEE